MRIDGPALLTALKTAGPFTTDQLRDHLCKHGYCADTEPRVNPAEMLQLLMALKKAGRVVICDGFWAVAQFSPMILRIDDEMQGRLHAIADILKRISEQLAHLVVRANYNYIPAGTLVARASDGCMVGVATGAIACGKCGQAFDGASRTNENELCDACEMDGRWMGNEMP
jgi:hypothetical protein